jgi:hypothetical protein
MKFPRLTAALTLVFVSTMGGNSLADGVEDPLAPMYAQWRVNYDRSYALAMADDDLPERNPVVLDEYVTTMAKTMSLTFTDSLITYTRGAHRRDMKFEVAAVLGEEITIKILAGENSQHWVLRMDDEGFLHLESTATKLTDFWVYEQGAPELDAAAARAKMQEERAKRTGEGVR